jgi:hypothetical protein
LSGNFDILKFIVGLAVSQFLESFPQGFPQIFPNRSRSFPQTFLSFPQASTQIGDFVDFWGLLINGLGNRDVIPGKMAESTDLA